MDARGILLASLVVASLAQACHGDVLFSTLPRTLIISASPQPDQVFKAGENKFTVTWGLNTSVTAGADSTYKTVKVKLCYAPISQKDRGWRKTKDSLAKDKTCPHLIVAKPYSASDTTFDYTVQKDVPQATYFIRVYAFNIEGHQVAYGQTTNAAKTTNLFEIQAITGRHASLDIASICFSAFSVLSLVGFFILEKKRGKDKSELSSTNVNTRQDNSS